MHSGSGFEQGVDWLGSLLVTTSLVGAIYAIVDATRHGWVSAQVLGVGGAAAVVMAAFLALEARIEHPILPLWMPPPAWTGERESRPGLAGDRHVLDVLPRHALSRARPSLSALQPGEAFLPWTITVAILSQGVTARLVGRFGPLPVLTTGMASAAAGLLLFATVGPDTAFYPTIFLAFLRDGLGIGNAFMPLLTLAMADLPAADAGLGSGITNVAQQISGALGLAVLSTIAANHTEGLLSDGHGLDRSLIGGYQLAFLAGAATIAAGIVLAFALLRPRNPRPELRLAQAPLPPASPPTSKWSSKQHDAASITAPRARRQIRRVSDGVVASYIHDIAAPAPRRRSRQQGAPRGRKAATLGVRLRG